MSKSFKIIDGDISDGYHTFSELYDHRCLLFLNLCLDNGAKCFWKPDFEGWFCLYYESPRGQISYHIPDKFKYLVEGSLIRNDTHKFDGHTSQDVLKRLEENVMPLVMLEEK